jgi:hypothetical protein
METEGATLAKGVLIPAEKYEQLIRESEALNIIARLILQEKTDYMNISAIKTILGIGGASK